MRLDDPGISAGLSRESQWKHRLGANMREVIPQNIMDAIQDLPDGLQQQVLDYLQSLEHSAPPGASGPSWRPFAGTNPRDDLQAMRAATWLGCEQVDDN